MQDRLPTAFMCVNDQTAIGVMLGLTARGYKHPARLLRHGFDDVPLSGFMSPRSPPSANPAPPSANAPWPCCWTFSAMARHRKAKSC